MRVGGAGPFLSATACPGLPLAGCPALSLTLPHLDPAPNWFVVPQAYGSKGVGEIPPNATLTIDLELLSIKQSVFGTRVKLVEG